MKSLYVFDVSPFIHIGMSIGEIYTRSNMPLNGMHYMLKFLTSCLSSEDEVVCCFDSPSFRKSIDSSYKSGRNFKPEVSCQCKMLYDILPKCGVQCFKEDGYEADDLVYSICSQHKHKYDLVIVYSADKDLYCNIDMNKVEFFSISSQVPSLNGYNFPDSAMKGVRLPLNTIDLYKVLCGDKSDNIREFQTEGGVKGRDLFSSVSNLIFKNNLPSDVVRDRKFVDNFLKAYSNYFTEKDISEIKKRVELIYPRELEILSDKFTSIKDIDLVSMESFLCMIKDKYSIINLGLEPRQSTKEELDLIYSYGKSLITGEFLADNSLSFNKKNAGFDLVNLKEF